MYFKKVTLDQVAIAKPRPTNMKVGQVVKRTNIKTSYRASLMYDLRRALKKGMEFSMAEDKGVLAIRRDK